MDQATFDTPDLSVLCRLDELRLGAVEQRLEPGPRDCCWGCAGTGARGADARGWKTPPGRPSRGRSCRVAGGVWALDGIVIDHLTGAARRRVSVPRRRARPVGSTMASSPSPATRRGEGRRLQPRRSDEADSGRGIGGGRVRSSRREAEHR